MRPSATKLLAALWIQTFVSEYISKMFSYLPPNPQGTKEINNPAEERGSNSNTSQWP